MTVINSPGMAITSLNDCIIPHSLQDLHPADAKLCLSVEKFCLTHLFLQKNSKLILAISGGADSTALAIIFNILKLRLNVKLAAMQIDHGLRPEAREEALFVQDLCNLLNIPIHLEKIDTHAIAYHESRSLEDAGRVGRLRLLQQFRLNQKADYILMAHHSGDLSEDILMRLIRGTGWPALGGMRAREGCILRPLLHTNPQVLRNFLQRYKIPWCEDKSNACLDFRRNRIRHLVLPLLEKENPSLKRTMLHLYEMSELDRTYWENLLEQALDRIPWIIKEEYNSQKIILPAKLLRTLHPAARLRLYHKCIKLLCTKSTARGQARSDTLFKLAYAYDQKSKNGRFQFTGNVEARIEGPEIIFELRED